MFDGTGWDNAATIAASEEVGAIGDFRHYVFMDRLGTVMTRDDSVYTASDQVLIKARKRYDSFFDLAAAFLILKGATS
jgi:HK97 family phage major capsid protein